MSIKLPDFCLLPVWVRGIISDNISIRIKNLLGVLVQNQIQILGGPWVESLAKWHSSLSQTGQLSKNPPTKCKKGAGYITHCCLVLYTQGPRVNFKKKFFFLPHLFSLTGYTSIKNTLEMDKSSKNTDKAWYNFSCFSSRMFWTLWNVYC